MWRSYFIPDYRSKSLHQIAALLILSQKPLILPSLLSAEPVIAIKLFDMSLSIYIGAVKSEKFDYYKPYSGPDISSATYCPERIMDISPLVGINDPLFSAIMMDNLLPGADNGCLSLSRCQ